MSIENGSVMSSHAKRIKTEHEDNGVVVNDLPEYPYDLQKLMHPMLCLLCNIRSNSKITAADHYNSKAHKHNIECWLKENSPETVKQQGSKDEQASNIFCSFCKLQLTSIAHAKQHYEGRKHRMVQEKNSRDKNGELVQNGLSSGLGHNEASLNKSSLSSPTLSPPCIQNDGKSLKRKYNNTDLIIPLDLEQCLKTVGKEIKILRSEQNANKEANKLHCELCDLQLTSVIDAQRHYGGRRHILVRNNLAKPSGDGHFGQDGKWVRTGSKLTPTCIDDGRFGIGEAFLHKPSESIQNNVSNRSVQSNFWCNICDIPLTSTMDFDVHIKGVKHLKKADKLNDEGINLKYRLPSGAYYCDICDTNFNGIATLTSHLNGKRHAKAAALINA